MKLCITRYGFIFAQIFFQSRSYRAENFACMPAPIDSVDKTKTLEINVTNRNFFAVFILQQQKRYMCKYSVQS